MKSKKIIVLALSLMMVLSMSAVNAFAEVNDNTTTTVDNKSGAKITKNLKIAEGITVPNETFTFTFAADTERYASEAGYVNPSTTTYPTINPVQIAYDSNDRTANGSDVEIKKCGSIEYPTTFPKSGMYVYKVQETAGTDSNMTYDDAVYYIKFYIKNGRGGEKTIENVEIVDPTDGDKIDAGTDGGKEDTSYSTNESNDGSDDVNGNDFIFTNIYVPEEVTNDPAGDSVAFKLSKIISGEYAGADDQFTFDVTVDYPDTYTGEAKSSTGDFTGSFADNSAVPVTLKGGQAMTFASLPQGTKITVNERSFENYTASYSEQSGVNEEKNGAKAAVTQTAPAKSTALSAGTLLVGKYGANITYTNTYETVTPTGIIINNLPYVLLIAIALGGIILFSRKRRYE